MLCIAWKNITQILKNLILKGDDFINDVWHKASNKVLIFKRWSPENKANQSPYTFMGFGAGPRNCVGMRFALEEMKIAICTMVQKFRFFPVEETPVRS